MRSIGSGHHGPRRPRLRRPEALLSPDECAAIAALYPDDTNFRSHIVMARHGFGHGEYRYFSYPLPDLIAIADRALSAACARQSLERALGIDIRYPDRTRRS